MAIMRSSMSKQITKSPSSGNKKVPKDACYRKVKAQYKVFPSAYASGAIAKCRKKGKKAEGGVITAKNGKAFRKRKSSKKNVARGCGQVLNERRKVTKYR